MSFAYDWKKNTINMTKHGIDFVEAQRLWDDSKRKEVEAKPSLSDEERFLVVGKIDDKFWTAIVTYREDVIRIISVRRSRSDEVERYES